MLAAIVALSFVVPVDAPKEKDKELTEAAKKGLKKLEGKWKGVKVVADGKEVEPTMNGMDLVVEFKARKFLFLGEDLFEVAALDPSTDPKLLDFKALKDMGEIKKGDTYEGIYKLDGDKLTLALATTAGGNRPGKFESAENSKVVLVTFEREKK
jgi:uncharacterized protein (TIGR03067 family)